MDSASHTEELHVHDLLATVLFIWSLCICKEKSKIRLQVGDTNENDIFPLNNFFTPKVSLNFPLDKGLG
jgi:hypothetical protein